MRKHHYLRATAEHPKLPLGSALFMATSLKVFNAPGWVWGVLGVLYVIALLLELYRLAAYEPVDLDDIIDNINERSI